MDERNSKRDREEVVAAFFDSLRTFNYDKAKDLVVSFSWQLRKFNIGLESGMVNKLLWWFQDKQKELCKSHPAPAVWPLILTALAQLAVAEKSYTSFFYLSPKWFGRRDVSIHICICLLLLLHYCVSTYNLLLLLRQKDCMMLWLRIVRRLMKLQCNRSCVLLHISADSLFLTLIWSQRW